jgi:glycosyltransferase involved in cell wall biosynthesis
VLDDAALARRLGEAARESAETQYSWQVAVDRLERFYLELPSRTRSVSAAYRQEASVTGGR